MLLDTEFLSWAKVLGRFLSTRSPTTHECGMLVLTLPLLLSAQAFIAPQGLTGVRAARYHAPLQTSSTVPLVALHLRGGAVRGSASPKATIAAADTDDYRPERALMPTAFMFVLSVAIVALTPIIRGVFF